MKKILLIIFLLLLYIQTGFAQTDTIIYRKANNKPAMKDDATVRIEIVQKKENSFRIKRYTRDDDKWNKSWGKETAYVIDDSTLRIVTEYSRRDHEVIVRKFARKDSLYYFKDYFDNQQLEMEGLTRTLLPLHKEGEIIKYFESGKVATIAVYEDNQMISNKNWLESGEKYVDNFFTSVDVGPEYPGGDLAFRQHIARNLRYPVRAAKNKIEGRVFLQFVIDENGGLTGLNVFRSVDPDLDAEAKRVVQSAPLKWSAGMLDDRKVKVMFTMPINFVLR